MHRIALATKVVRDRPLAEVARIAAEAGFDGVELFALPGHVTPETPDREVGEIRRLCEERGLPIVDLCTYGRGLAESSDAECAEEVARFRRYLEIAAQLDCRMVRAWADRLGRLRLEPRADHWRRAAHYLGVMCDLAADQGVTVLLESHPTMTHSPEAVLELLGLVDRPNLKLNYDPANVYLCGADHGRAGTLRLRPHIANVQIKEASRSLPTVEHDDHDGTLRGGGTFDLMLGEGDMPKDGFLRALIETGYDGFYVVECHRTPTADLPSEEIARRELASVRALLDAAAAKSALLSAGAGRSGIDLDRTRRQRELATHPGPREAPTHSLAVDDALL